MNNTEVAELFNEAMRMGLDLTPVAEWLQSIIDEERARTEYANLPYTTSSEEIVIYGPGDNEVMRINAFSENTLDDVNDAVAADLGRDNIKLWGYSKDSMRVNHMGTTKISDFDRKSGNIYFYLPEVPKANMTARVPTVMSTASRDLARQYGDNIVDMFKQYGLDPSAKYSIQM